MVCGDGLWGLKARMKMGWAGGTKVGYETERERREWRRDRGRRERVWKEGIWEGMEEGI